MNYKAKFIMLLLFIMYLHLIKIKKYYLSYLIGLEYLSSFFLFIMILNNYEMWMFMFFMVYFVCEAVVGLSLLISLNFYLGHDKINIMTMC